MGRPTTRQASKEGACAYPSNYEARDESESITHDSEDKERREVSGSKQGASDEEANKETEWPKFQFTRTKGVQPSWRRIVYKCQ